MLYCIIALAILAIYQHFRICYVRDKWTELLKQRDVKREISDSDKENISSILAGYYKSIYKQIEKRYGSDYIIELKKWCVSEASKNCDHNLIEAAKNIEDYITHKNSSQERFDKLKDKNPDLSRIKEMLNEKVRFVDINVKRKNESIDDFIKRCKD